MHKAVRDPRLLVVVMTLAVQAVLISITFPVTEVVSDKALWFNDHALHLYQIKAGRDLSRAGKLTGYDPTFGAGSVAGARPSSARVPLMLVVALDRWLPDVVLYKLYVFVCALVAPAMVPLALRCLDTRLPAVAAGAVWSLALWWASWFRWMSTEGMVAFVTVSYLSIPYFVGVVQWLSGKWGTKTLMVLGALGAALFFFHPHFPLAIAVGTVAYVVISWRWLVGRRVLTLLLVVPVISVIPNIYWLLPLYKYRETTELGLYFTAVDPNFLWKELAGIYGGGARGSKVYAPLLICTLGGAFLSSLSSERRVILAFTIAGLALIVLAAIGGAFPLVRHIEPNRLAPLGYLFLVPAAAIGVTRMLDAAFGGRRHRGLPRLVARVALVCAAVTTAYSMYEVAVEVSSLDVGRYGRRPPQVRHLPDQMDCIGAWLQGHTSRQGRILFEVYPGEGYASESAYYAHRISREFIGGPLPHLSRVDFVAGQLFGEPVADMPADVAMRYMMVYNVGWVVAYKPDTKAALERIPQVVQIKQCHDRSLYAVRQPLSYFLEGAGVVTSADLDNIVLDALEGHAITLKYNYVPGLTSLPQAEIVPVVSVPGMPPFIRIIEPPRHLRLYVKR